MSTKHLKKRDRAWAKGTVSRWHSGFGRDFSTTTFNRNRTCRAAEEWLKGNDPFQQEALAIKP